jgi:hypothetical protein
MSATIIPNRAVLLFFLCTAILVNLSLIMYGDAIREGDPPGPSPRSGARPQQSKCLGHRELRPNDIAVHATKQPYRVFSLPL